MMENEQVSSSEGELGNREINYGILSGVVSEIPQFKFYVDNDKEIKKVLKVKMINKEKETNKYKMISHIK